MNSYYNGTYQASVVDTFQTMWYRIVAFLPNVLAAIIVLILGWLIAAFLGRLVMRVLEAIRIDQLANRVGLDHLSQRVGKKLSVARFGAWLVKWFVIILTVIATANILGLPEVGLFLQNKVIGYFPNVIVAVLILLIGLYAANFLSELVRGALKAGELRSSEALASATRWAITIFTVIAALSQLNIAKEFTQDLFRGIVVMLAVAGGIAFGLGGKDHAKKVLDSIESDISNR